MKSPRTWVKKIVCALSIFAVGATTVTPAIYAQDDAKAKEEAAAIQDVQSYIAIEQTSGKILMQNNQDEVRGIASMSKMISQYLILEAIKNGEVTWETQIPVSDRVHQLSANYSLSNVPLLPSEKYTIKELFDAISIYSANAATLAVAEYIGGSEANWIERMKAKLDEWGIKDATIINVTGLPNKYGGADKNPSYGDEDENSMSARSVAIIAKNLVNDFPEPFKYSSLISFVFSIPSSLNKSSSFAINANFAETPTILYLRIPVSESILFFIISFCSLSLISKLSPSLSLNSSIKFCTKIISC